MKLRTMNLTLFAWTLLLFSQCTAATKVLELSDKFIDVSKNGHWFVMFYAPWCGHCKKLEPVWHQVAQSLHNTNIRVAKVDCTRFSSVATEFTVKGFPTIIFMKDGQNFHYNGDRSRDAIVDYVERMSQPPILQIEDSRQLKNIMEARETFFLYAGNPSGPLWEAYNVTAHEFQQYIYFYSASHMILESNGIDSVPPTAAIAVYKDQKLHLYRENEPIVLETRLDLSDVSEGDDEADDQTVIDTNVHGLDNLRHWINHERFPSMVKITPGNFHQVLKTQKFIVIAVLEEDKVGRLTKTMRECKDTLEEFAQRYRHVYHEKFLFGWTGSPDLVNSVAMTALPVPSMIVINATSFHHHFPEEHFEVLTHEALADFLDRILKDEIQAFGGTGVLMRAYRLYYDVSSTLRGMWRGNPVLTTVILGLPLGFLSLICYSIWCADIMDAGEDEPAEREKED